MPTRAGAETILASPSRAGGFLAAAGVAVTGPSPIALFSDPIAGALAACGVAVADPTNPTDSDMNMLANAKWPKFLDIAHLLLMEGVAQGRAFLNQSQSWSDFSISRSGALSASMLQDKREQVRRQWGYGASLVTAGAVDLNFTDQTNEF